MSKIIVIGCPGAESRIGKKRDDLPWIEEKLDEEFKQNIVKQDYFLHGKWFIKTVYSKNVSNEILDKWRRDIYGI